MCVVVLFSCAGAAGSMVWYCGVLVRCCAGLITVICVVYRCAVCGVVCVAV